MPPSTSASACASPATAWCRCPTRGSPARAAPELFGRNPLGRAARQPRSAARRSCTAAWSTRRRSACRCTGCSLAAARDRALDRPPVREARLGDRAASSARRSSTAFDRRDRRRAPQPRARPHARLGRDRAAAHAAGAGARARRQPRGGRGRGRRAARAAGAAPGLLRARAAPGSCSCSPRSASSSRFGLLGDAGARRRRTRAAQRRRSPSCGATSATAGTTSARLRRAPPTRSPSCSRCSARLTFWAPSFEHRRALPRARFRSPALAAWCCAARFSRRGWAPAVAAVLWALAPPFLASLDAGHLGAVIAHLLLPWLVLAAVECGAQLVGGRCRRPALRRGRGERARARARAAARLARLARRQPARASSGSSASRFRPIVLFAPLVMQQVVRGNWLALFAEPGVPWLIERDAIRLAARARRARRRPQRLGRARSPGSACPPIAAAFVVAVLLAPLAGLALLALFLPGSTPVDPRHGHRAARIRRPPSPARTSSSPIVGDRDHVDLAGRGAQPLLARPRRRRRRRTRGARAARRRARPARRRWCCRRGASRCSPRRSPERSRCTRATAGCCPRS